MRKILQMLWGFISSCLPKSHTMNIETQNETKEENKEETLFFEILEECKIVSYFFTKYQEACKDRNNINFYNANKSFFDFCKNSNMFIIANIGMEIIKHWEKKFKIDLKIKFCQDLHNDLFKNWKYQQADQVWSYLNECFKHSKNDITNVFKDFMSSKNKEKLKKFLIKQAYKKYKGAQEKKINLSDIVLLREIKDSEKSLLNLSNEAVKKYLDLDFFPLNTLKNEIKQINNLNLSKPNVTLNEEVIDKINDKINHKKKFLQEIEPYVNKIVFSQLNNSLIEDNDEIANAKDEIQETKVVLSDNDSIAKEQAIIKTISELSNAFVC